MAVREVKEEPATTTDEDSGEKEEASAMQQQVREEFFTDYGDCCGGPSGTDGPDDELWARIQRTPAQKDYENSRSYFSAQVRPPRPYSPTTALLPS